MSATYYVSKSADNGYVIGNDVNNGTAKSTPFLTVKKGLDTAANGDTVIVNGGAVGNTYSFTAVYSGATWWTLIPDPSGGAVTLQDATGADTRIMTLGVASGQYTIGALGGPQIIFDAQGANTWCLATSNAGVLTSLNLLNVSFINWTTQACELDQITTCIVDACVFAASASATANFIVCDLHGRASAATLTYTVRNCTFNLGTLTVNGQCLQYQGTDGATVNINNNTFTMNIGGSRSVICFNNPAGSTVSLTGNTFNGTITGTGNTWRGLRHTGGVMNLTATANTFNINSTDNNICIGFDTETSGYVVIGGITPDLGNTWTSTANGALTSAADIGGFAKIALAISGLSTKNWILNNTIINPVGVNGGYTSVAILIGSNGTGSNPANSSSQSGVLIQYNSVNGGNHGILVGHLAGVALVSGNLIKNTVLGVVFKDTTGSGTNVNLACGNVIVATVSHHEALVGRGSQGDKFFNNTIIVPAGADGTQIAFETYDDPGAQGASLAVLYANNLVYIDPSVTATHIADVGNTVGASSDSGSTATYQNNCYYGTLSATAFKYQAVSQAYSAWVSAHETTALASTPKFVNYAGGDYRVPPSSGLYQAGAFIDARAVDYRGRPYNVKPTIGAYEVTGGDPAGTRLTRSITVLLSSIPLAGFLMALFSPYASGGEAVALNNVPILLVAVNAGISSEQVSVLSAPDLLNRYGDISDTLAPGTTRIFGPFPSLGWSQSNGQLWFQGTDGVQFAVVAMAA